MSQDLGDGKKDVVDHACCQGFGRDRREDVVERVDQTGMSGV